VQLFIIQQVLIAAVCVLDFGADKTATSGTFTIQFPAFTAAAAILRIA
jgi:hypothetical protein